MRNLAPLALVILAACKPNTTGGGAGGADIASSSSAANAVSASATSASGAGGQGSTSSSAGGAGGQGSTSSSTSSATTGSTGAGGGPAVGLWSAGFPSSSFATCVASDPAGNVVAGYISHSPDSVHLVKIDPAGTVVWDKILPAGATEPVDVGVDAAGNIFLEGRFTGSITLGGSTFQCPPFPDPQCVMVFLAKFDPAGNSLWSKAYSSGLQSPAGLVVDSAGDVTFTGLFTGTVDFGGGAQDSAPGTTHSGFFLAKLGGASGAFLWNKIFQDMVPLLRPQGGLAVDGAGNLLVTGSFDYKLNFGGGLLQPPDSDYDMFLVKFTSAGDFVWNKQFGLINEDDAGHAVAATAAGEILVTGKAGLNLDLGGGPLPAGDFVARFDAGGNHLWSKHLLLDSRVALDGAGDAVIAGPSGVGPVDLGGGSLPPIGTNDLVAAKLDAGGKHVWSKRFGVPQPGPQTLGLYDLASDAAGNAILGGLFGPTVDFGSGPLTCNGSQCALVTKVGP